MISFIVIARNEGWKLSKCFQSIYDTIGLNQLDKYEIIYVDSNSEDNSIQRAKEFPDIRIIKITEGYNAAVSRNIGADESQGDVLFFIDGDMEIDPTFLPRVYEKGSQLTYDFVSGQVKNYYYNVNGKFLHNSLQFKKLLDDEFHHTTGGIFIIKKHLWKQVEGMDNNFRKGQDHDFALRLTKMGYPILRKKEVIANHHTIEYINEKRMWSTIYRGNILYPNVFLLRKHLFNNFVYKGLFRSNYTTVALIIFLCITILTSYFWWLYGYVSILIFKVFKNRRASFIRNLELLSYYIVRDIVMIVAFIAVPMKKVRKEKIRYIYVK
jgi:glycosyltransferase involved in cell wall biosynthesis